MPNSAGADGAFVAAGADALVLLEVLALLALLEPLPLGDTGVGGGVNSWAACDVDGPLRSPPVPLEPGLCGVVSFFFAVSRSKPNSAGAEGAWALPDELVDPGERCAEAPVDELERAGASGLRIAGAADASAAAAAVVAAGGLG